MRLPADLLPARASFRFDDDMLPVIPEWWPLDPAPTDEQPHPRPYTPEQRRALREQKRAREACSGPYDGQRLAAAFPDGGKPPRVFVPFNRQDVRYVLDEAESTPYRLRYRYDPTSPIHRNLMIAVSEAYAELGKEYTIASREDDPR